MSITASKIYDYIQCPHKVWRDIYGPQEEKSKEINPFVQLLWDRGVAHEEKILAGMGEYADISKGSLKERTAKTLEAMKSGVPLIYQGVIEYNNLLGIPDLLKKVSKDCYIPIDIKSGSGMAGADEDAGEEGKPKKHYAFQLCLYAEALIGNGFATDKKGLTIDAHGKTVEYGLDEWWDKYEETKNTVKNLTDNKFKNNPALGGVCKLCPWYESCKKWCKETNDLTNVFYLGRAKRDQINEELGIQSVDQLSKVKLEEIVARKKADKSFLKGVGPDTIAKFIKRADILTNTKKPAVFGVINLPETSYELYFDIEDDPTRELVYLHGIWERHNGKKKFISFVAKDEKPESEKLAWQEFWDYIKKLPKDDFSVYYYSPHEKTTYRKLQKKYPDVISATDLEEFFSNPKVIDLYRIIFANTEWPLSSYSVKAIAVYLGFKWRDETPGGAQSIEWFNSYIETGDKKHLDRILIYNEDDCRAMAVIKDFLDK